MASTGDSDVKSDYVELTENSPTSPANTPDLAGHTRKLEGMHKAAESELVEITRPKVISTALTRSNFQILTMPIPTRRKTSKTVAPHHQSSTRHLHCTHSWRRLYGPIRVYSTLMRQGRQRRPSSARERLPRCLPTRSWLNAVWRLPGLGIPKSRRTLGWRNSGRQ